MSLQSRVRDGKFTFIEWALLATFGALIAIRPRLSGYVGGKEFTESDLNFYIVLFAVYLIAECLALILPTKIPRKFDLVAIGVLCALYIFNIDLFYINTPQLAARVKCKGQIRLDIKPNNPMEVPHAYYAKARTCPAACSGVRLRQFDSGGLRNFYLFIIVWAFGSSSGSYSSSGSSSNSKGTGNAKSTTEYVPGDFFHPEDGYITWITDEHRCLAASAKGPTAEMSQKLASEAYDRKKG